jgi:hypothetical protein
MHSLFLLSFNRCVIQSLLRLERTNGMYNNTPVHTMEVKSIGIHEAMQ